MSDLTAKRTLVKSPPELWTELSEVESLARHLGEFGEIRITKLEPETTVAWEGERASGTVEIAASGWGTKVTLTAEVVAPETPVDAPLEEPGGSPRSGDGAGREVAAPPTAEPEGEHDAQSAPEPAPPPAHARAEPTLSPPIAERRPSPTPAPPRPANPRPAKQGFIARLLGRRPVAQPQRPVWQPPEPPPPWTAPHSVPPPAQPARTPEPGPAEVAAPPRQPSPAAAAPEPLSDAEPAIDSERALAVLEGALDTLGSAHHRPFSRG